MYPRIIKLSDPKLLELEQKKGQLIEEGRGISEQIEAVELEMGKLDVRLQAEEAKVDVTDLKAKQADLGKQMDASLKFFTDEIKALQQQIFDRMTKQTNPVLREKHQQLLEQKSLLETERNKKALKAEKFKDRIIPLARKLMRPLLENEYEDFFDLKLENGEMIGKIFSHLDDFEKRHKQRLKDNYLTK